MRSGAEEGPAGQGPLSGVRVVEIAGIGPGPFCAMMLADMGAEVVRIDRAGNVTGGDPATPPADILNRGRRSVGVDLKHREGVEAVLALVERADALIEGFRPGVTERLGIGPDECLARNPRLVYGRMTGWGQDGPWALEAGHDINYISLAGALDPCGRAGEAPVPPMNLVGDFGGGAMFLAFGVVCGILEARSSGQGQVIDAAMVDGAATLTTMMHGMMAMGFWDVERGTNMLDTGAFFYEVYRTKDDKFVSVGSIEPQFYAALIEGTGLGGDTPPAQMDRANWPARKKDLAAIFLTRTRDEWCERLEGHDICFAPVLSMVEAPHHPHMAARGTFTDVAGITQPGPAPRFSRTPGAITAPPPHAGQHTDEALVDWGLTPERVADLRESGAIR